MNQDQAQEIQERANTIGELAGIHFECIAQTEKNIRLRISTAADYLDTGIITNTPDWKVSEIAKDLNAAINKVLEPYIKEHKVRINTLSQ